MRLRELPRSLAELPRDAVNRCQIDAFRVSETVLRDQSENMSLTAVVDPPNRDPVIVVDVDTDATSALFARSLLPVGRLRRTAALIATHATHSVEEHRDVRGPTILWHPHGVALKDAALDNQR